MSAVRTSEPRLLILETSGRIGRVGLALGPKLLGERALDETRRHARDLVPAIVALCGEQSWRVRDLDGVAVSLGPGSYTGLRVGIMTAKTLAYATGCVALGLETFAAIARQAAPELAASTIDVLADAQQQNVYVQRWRRMAWGWASGPLRILPVNDWRGDFPLAESVTGPGLQMHESNTPYYQRKAPMERRDPTPASLLEIALERWHRGEADDALALEPLYLRPSSAEENWTRLGK